MPKNEDLYMTDALRRWREKTDVPFLIVAIASIPFLLLELVSHRLAGSDKVLLLIVNVVVLAVFAVGSVGSSGCPASATSMPAAARRSTRWPASLCRPGFSPRGEHQVPATCSIAMLA